MAYTTNHMLTSSENTTTWKEEQVLHLLTSVLKHDSIYALSETEPWGTLLASGEKENETRGWPPLISQNTLYRGPLAIHTAKRMDNKVCFEEPFASTLRRLGYTPDRHRRSNHWRLPLGCIIGLAWLDTIWQVNSRSQHRIPDEQSHEFAFGNYHEGRYIWQFSCAYRLHIPIPISHGETRLWKWTPPESVWNELQTEVDRLHCIYHHKS